MAIKILLIYSSGPEAIFLVAECKNIVLADTELVNLSLKLADALSSSLLPPIVQILTKKTPIYFCLL